MTFETVSVLSTSQSTRRMPHLQQLDGWRAISILAVLCAHLLPLGPARWDLNGAAALLGMSVFFTLSGFLITTSLYSQPSVRVFVIRRVFRIVPLALLYIVLALTVLHAPLPVWIAHVGFYANLPPFRLTPFTSHIWSLCVEMQYYAATAVLFLLFRERSFILAPVLAVVVTGLRVYTQTRYSIVTIYRVDEILTGATLAYLYHGKASLRFRRLLFAIPPIVPLAFLLLSTHSNFGSFNYLRPYFAALTVGATLAPRRVQWNVLLSARPLRHIASISYALYIWQGLAYNGWLEEGSKLVKYEKRPLGIALTLLFAHLSTKFYEHFWIQCGKKLCRPLTGTAILITGTKTAWRTSRLNL